MPYERQIRQFPCMLSGLKTGIRHLAESLFSDSNRESKSKLCTLRRPRREGKCRFSRTLCAALPLRNRRKRRGVFLDAKRIGEQKGRTLFPIGSPFKGFCALSERNCRFGYFAVGVFMSIHRDERKQAVFFVEALVDALPNRRDAWQLLV